MPGSVPAYYTRVVDTQGVRDAYGESVTASAAEIICTSAPGLVGSGAALAAGRSSASERSVSGKTRRRAREYQRIAVRCGCWLEHEQATVYGTTVDLGRGGLFLRTALPMPPGVSVRVTLRLPGQATVVAEGKIVRHVAPHSGDRPGLGVRFERLPDGEDSLCAFLFGSLRDEQEAAELASTG
jgi:uncharacterized protein (TIGR02266 family)